jgi:hypothetical protein
MREVHKNKKKKFILSWVICKPEYVIRHLMVIKIAKIVVFVDYFH